jgi:hypothetical protein
MINLSLRGVGCHVAYIAVNEEHCENRGDLYSTAPARDGRNAADALLNVSVSQ